MEVLILNGTNVNAVNEHNDTALLKAAAEGNKELSKKSGINVIKAKSIYDKNRVPLIEKSRYFFQN